MWRLLLILTFVSSVWALAGATPRPTIPATSSGPVSDEEATILWRDGQENFAQEKYDLAAGKFERLIARYPGYAGYLEAHALLARSYLKMGKPAQAKSLLKDYILAAKKPLEVARAQVELTRAYLALKQHTEALLTADEALRHKLPDQPEVSALALALKSRALIALNHDQRAVQALDSAKKQVPSQAVPALQGEILSAALELKLHQCGKFPGKGPLDEAQVRDQLDRRGTCLLESLIVFRDLLTAGDLSSSGKAQKQLNRAYRSYLSACATPPPPIPLKPKDRTPRQRQTYFKEMGVVLEQDCQQKLKQSLETLNGWSATTPPSTASFLKLTVTNLEKLARPRGAKTK